MSLWMKKARILAQGILESEEVRVSLQQRLIKGELSEDLELLLFQLAYPPVRERVRPVEPLSTESKRALTLAFPICADPRDTRRTEARPDGDANHVAVLEKETH